MIPESEIRAAVREILAEMLGVQSQSKPRRKFYPTSKAWKEVGCDNQEQLYDAIASGLLRVGYEVEDRRKPSAKLARYYL